MRPWLPLVVLALWIGGCGGGAAKTPDAGGQPDATDEMDATMDAETPGDVGGDSAGTDGGAIDPLLHRLATGRNHSCAINAKGEIWCWGGETTALLRPLKVMGLPAETPTGVSSGGDGRTCALLASGKAWCWDNGKAPAEVAGIAGAKQLAVGDGFTCALLSDGSVSCWGVNGSGQLGDGTTTDRPAPGAVKNLADAKELGVGAAHACARRSDGSIWCWGDNNSWQLGDKTTINRYGPVQVQGLPEQTVQLAVGPRHGCVRASAGAVWCWGLNGAGESTSSGAAYAERAMEFTALEPSVELRAGGFRSSGEADHAVTCSRKQDGSMWCAGRGADGELGDGTVGGDGTDTPVRVFGLGSVPVEISIGGRHTCVGDAAKQISCWGYNYFGQLGRDAPYAPLPVRLETTGPFTEVGAGQFSSIGRTLDRYYVWGDNRNAQLGVGSVTTVATPLPVIGLPIDVQQWGVGELYACWLRATGQVLCSGGKFGRSAVPVTAVGTDNTKLAVGNGHACVLKTNGNIWCWGTTMRGGTAAMEQDPAAFDPSNNYLLFAGYLATCYKTQTGPINCYDGEYGSSSFEVPAGNDPIDFAINGHWCARKIDGTVWCGASPTDSHKIDITDTVQIAVTRESSCARKVDGTVWCWGANPRGELGSEGAATMTPTAVKGLPTGITKLTAGFRHVCALDGTGRIWCWGDNYMNQLGDGLGGNRVQPQPVIFP